MALYSEFNAVGNDLEANGDLLRGVLAGCGDCIKVLDLDGRLQFMSEGGKKVMEVDDFSVLKGCPWPDFWEGQGNTDAIASLKMARSGYTGRFKGAANTARGNPRYWDVQVSPLWGPDGRPSHLLSISRDITAEWTAIAELKDAVERQRLLTEELAHRIKNTLAMVSAIANQTMRGNDVAAARSAFNDRLMTLSKAHDILTQFSWTSAPIDDVVEGALAPHRSGRGQFSIIGPSVTLQPKPALALALAIHELATNAIKYGSLSADGKVDIKWIISTDQEPIFRFAWTENGGPTVTAPDQSKAGFGSRLINRMLSADFAGTVTLNYKPTGAVCELVAPLNAIVG